MNYGEIDRTDCRGEGKRGDDNVASLPIKSIYFSALSKQTTLEVPTLLLVVNSER